MLRISAARKWPYLFAAVVVAAAAGLRLALDPLLQRSAPLDLFTCGVVVAALYGGARSGIAATFLSIPVCDYLFIEPRYTWFIFDTATESISLVLFSAVGVGVTLVVERFHRTRERLRAADRELLKNEARLRGLAESVPEILFTTTSDGGIDYVSQRYSDYTGVPPERARAEWMSRIHPDDRQGVLETQTEALRAGLDFETMCRIQRADGEYRWFACHAKPVRGREGAIAQWTGVCTDIHEHKLLEEALARRSGELIEANEEFQRFAYRISHDLKEPLRMIGLYTEMLMRRNQEAMDEESRTFARHVLDGVDRAQQQMAELLEYATAGRVEIKRVLTDLNEIVELACTNLQATVVNCGAEITHDPMPSVISNPERILSVFQNLIGNALKYRGARPPRIHVSAETRDGEWIFAVKDNGAGFDMKDAGRIFGAFERLAAGSKIEGTGLGLAIVKRVVESKGGRVWAESTIGEGSTFYFTLPRREEDVPPALKIPPVQASGASQASRHVS